MVNSALNLLVDPSLINLLNFLVKVRAVELQAQARLFGYNFYAANNFQRSAFSTLLQFKRHMMLYIIPGFMLLNNTYSRLYSRINKYSLKVNPNKVFSCRILIVLY